MVVQKHKISQNILQDIGTGPSTNAPSPEIKKTTSRAGI